MTELERGGEDTPPEEFSSVDRWRAPALRFYHSRRFIGLILGVGVFVRLVQLLHARDLWHDEASLALNILGRTYAQLLLPLDYEQAAPVGFLMLVKLVVAAFGANDYTMRLVPFAASIASLFLFHGLAKRWLRPSGVPLASGLFAVSVSFIDFSANLKQYSSDVTAALITLWLAEVLARRGISWKRALCTALAGAACIWFSFSAVFMLAGVGVCLTASGAVRRDWKTVVTLCAIGAAWAVSFLAYYLLCLRAASQNPFLITYWTGAFMPLPPKSPRDLLWFSEAFFRMFYDISLGLLQPSLGAFAFVLGCAALAWRDRFRLAIILSPILMTLLASGLHKYPFSDRLIMFLSPVLLLGIGEGGGFILAKAHGRRLLIAAVFLLVLSGDQCIHAARRTQQPNQVQDITGTLEYLQQHRQPGDTVYVYHYADRPFLYYADQYGFKPGEYTLGVRALADPSKYLGDLDKLRGRARVWIVSVVIYQDREFNILRAYLDHIGKRLDAKPMTGAALYLYDLR